MWVGDNCSQENQKKKKKKCHEGELYAWQEDGGWDVILLFRLVRSKVISTVLAFGLAPGWWEKAARQRAMGRISSALQSMASTKSLGQRRAWKVGRVNAGTCRQCKLVWILFWIHYETIGGCWAKSDIIRFTFLKDHTSDYKESVL